MMAADVQVEALGAGIGGHQHDLALGAEQQGGVLARWLVTGALERKNATHLLLLEALLDPVEARAWRQSRTLRTVLCRAWAVETDRLIRAR